MNVFADLGFGFVKFLSGNHRVMFPSIAGETSPTELDIFGNGSGLELEVNGAHWLLGNSALRQSMLTSDLQRNDWILSPEWKAMLLAAITEVTTAAHVNIDVITGLPFSDYVNKPLRKEFTESLTGTYSIKRKGRTAQQATVSSVLCLTQNFAPIFNHVSNLTQDANIGVLNIGSHTVDIATVALSANGRPEAIKVQCGSLPRGTRSAVSSLKNVMSVMYPSLKLNEYEVDGVLQRGTVQLGGVEKPISVEGTLAPFLRSIEALISDTWLNDQKPVMLPKLSTLIITGGGARLVGDHIKRFIERQPIAPRVVIGSQFDVVEGYRKAWEVMR